MVTVENFEKPPCQRHLDWLSLLAVLVSSCHRLCQSWKQNLQKVYHLHRWPWNSCLGKTCWFLAENNFILAQQWLHIHMQADSHSVHGATLYLWLYKQWLSLIWFCHTAANHQWDFYSVALIQDFCFSWLKDSSLLKHLVCSKCPMSQSLLFLDLYR